MTDRIQVGTMLIQDGTRMPATVRRQHRALCSRLVIHHGLHQRSTRKTDRKGRMDILLHGRGDSYERLRLQRSVPGSSRYWRT